MVEPKADWSELIQNMVAPADFRSSPTHIRPGRTRIWPSQAQSLVDTYNQNGQGSSPDTRRKTAPQATFCHMSIPPSFRKDSFTERHILGI